jgi:ATP-dependent RNA helicase DDX54/DBP10
VCPFCFSLLDIKFITKSSHCRYSLKDGASFAEQAAHATFDLTTDEGVTGRQRHDKQLKWDRKKKKFIKGGGEGADNVKIVKTESGARLPASYRSGRFDEWKAKNKIALPRIGEAEPERARNGGNASAGGRRFKYNSTVQGKPLDPKHIGYERKLRLLKKKGGASADDEGKSNQPRGTSSNGRPAPLKKGHRSGKAGVDSRFGGANIGKVKNELKSADQIRKARALEARKKAKNARPNKKGKR